MASSFTRVIFRMAVAAILCSFAPAAWACTCGFGDGKFTLKTIRLDGNMSDWAPVFADPDNNVCDAAEGAGDRDGNIQSTGRDLLQFSATWDSNNFYGYTLRVASSTNTDNFIYYADTNNDGKMQTGEPVVVVGWSGNNRRVQVYIGKYAAVATGGDPLVSPLTGFGDGYKMPGTITSLPSSGNPDFKGTWGSADGIAMEWGVPWSRLGVPPGTAIRWHISSTNSQPGAGSFPAQIDDNMSGCGRCSGGNQFAALSFTPDTSSTVAKSSTTYEAHVLTNAGNGVDRFKLTSVISGSITSGVTVQYYKDVGTIGQYDAGTDTLLTDTDGDGIIDSGPLAAGAKLNILVAITVPAASGNVVVVTSATSTFAPSCATSTYVPPKASVTDTLTIAAGISGYVYNDADHSGALDNGESGTGLTLFVKLVPSAGGNATAAATVNPSTGAYAFPTVASGGYRLVLSTNNSLTDPSAIYPNGWLGTENSSGSISVTMSAQDLTQQDFGLYHGSRIVAGRVFNDNGTGGGTANDGSQQGGEPGLSNVLIKVTDSGGGLTYDQALTDAAGAFNLFIPSTASAVKIIESNPGGYISTGGSAGSTAGTYSRSTDTITFTAVAGVSYTGISFADVPQSALLTDGSQAGMPGTTLFFPHTFNAATAGQVTFTLAHAAAPGSINFSQVLYRDSNCNAQLDSGEPIIFGALPVNTGDKVCLIVKEFIPAAAPFDSTDQITLAAQFSFTNSSPLLSATYTRSDFTTVGNATSAGLTLKKSVDKATALPGDTLLYTITFTNDSSSPLSNIVVNDSTPAYTVFLNATCGTLGSGLSSCSIAQQPASLSTGALKWTFAGTLAPGASSTVTYSVRVQ